MASRQDTIFPTQNAALQFVEAEMKKRGYTIEYPDYLWCNHISYGHNEDYHHPLIVNKTGNHAKKWIHIFLYRFETGNYELTYYAY